ncbi:hypothetical protein BgAZ_502080 [Babesia gibsoni]|uniref:Uncharacterized protein n=1 Tax=Babesia gibsoni TaxID=33632 RepID=A0AAD8LMI5_BABGI|nr:hypothetical protein BgAZ_502080 [Babesia gibsoni]
MARLYTKKLAEALLSPCYGFTPYRRPALRFHTGISTITSNEVEVKRSAEGELQKSSETIMRISNGSVELVQGSTYGSLSNDIRTDVIDSVPHIDKNSFENYIEVPRQRFMGILEDESLKLFHNDLIPFKRYIPGTQSAHHYPLDILPRKLSMKLSGDIFVTTYSIHEKDYKVENGRRIRLSAIPTLKTTPNEVLLQKLYGRNVILIVFSGDLPHSDASGALEWKEAIDLDCDTHILLNSPAPIGASYFHKKYINSLATALVEKNDFSCILRKLTAEETIAFHQYRKQFASVLLLDKFGYIRWHAAGKPTREARYLLKEAYEKLLNEL